VASSHAFGYVSSRLLEVYRTFADLSVMKALPHVVDEDNEYDGYFIPKGTVVFGNAWYDPSGVASSHPVLLMILGRAGA